VSAHLVSIARPELLRRIGRARQSVRLVSPYLSREVARAIVDQVSISRPAERHFLTAVDGEQEGSAFLDPDALAALDDADFDIRSVPNLHAKVSIVDDGWCLIGSGNLTGTGIGGVRRPNVELGVIVDGAVRKKAIALVSDWWLAGTRVTRGQIDRMARTRPGGRRRRGQPIGDPLLVEQDDFVRASNDLRNPAARNRGYWVKAMYHDAARDRPNWWRRATWISDVHLPPRNGGGPRRRPSYRAGDFIVLYLKQPQRCPAIFEVVEEARYRPDVVARRAPGDESRWGWVTRVRVVAATDLQNAPLLEETGKVGRALQNGFVRLDARGFERVRRRIAPVDG
jgi:PLD-like domain